MGYDAFTPGEVDLSLGMKKLRAMSQKANFVFLLANFVEKKSNRPVFREMLVKKMGEMKVGLIGLISPHLLFDLQPEDTDQYVFLDPVSVAKKLVEELKKQQCQVIIALAHMKIEEMKTLAQSVPEISIIVNGHIREAETEPKMINQTAILISGDRGEFLGHADLWAEGKGVKSHYKIIPLSEKVGDHPQALAWLNQFKTTVQKLSPMASRFAAQTAPGQPLGFALSSFVGEETCASCHSDQHQWWQKTGHARAFQTLAKNKRTLDFTCLPCHTTGFEEAASPADILENVQCESCHGPRKGHPDSGNNQPGKVSEKHCLPCHNPAKSPKFDYAAYLAKIRCPAPK